MLFPSSPRQLCSGFRFIRIYPSSLCNRHWTNVVRALLSHGSHEEHAVKHRLTPEMLVRENGRGRTDDVFWEWLENQNRYLKGRGAVIQKAAIIGALTMNLDSAFWSHTVMDSWFLRDPPNSVVPCIYTPTFKESYVPCAVQISRSQKKHNICNTTSPTIVSATFLPPKDWSQGLRRPEHCCRQCIGK